MQLFKEKGIAHSTVTGNEAFQKSTISGFIYCTDQTDRLHRKEAASPAILVQISPTSQHDVSGVGGMKLTDYPVDLYLGMGKAQYETAQNQNLDDWRIATVEPIPLSYYGWSWDGPKCLFQYIIRHMNSPQNVIFSGAFVSVN